MSIEITKEAFWVLVGNDEETWIDYKAGELYESSYYLNLGVRLQSVCNFISGTVQYYIHDINS